MFCRNEVSFMNEQKELIKKAVGEKAVEFVENGMVIGLGSGSTMYWTLKKLGELIEEGLSIKGIPSSKRTERLAHTFRIPLTSFSEVDMLDLAIDGADEIDPFFNLTKGGGGSLVREKIVDFHAKKLIIVADESKLVPHLGKFPLPVEVLPFGWELTAQKINKLGATTSLRKTEGSPFISDNGNYILDCTFETEFHPEELHKDLKQILGVVETGLFVQMVDAVIIGNAKEITILNNPKK